MTILMTLIAGFILAWLREKSGNPDFPGQIKCCLSDNHRLGKTS